MIKQVFITCIFSVVATIVFAQTTDNNTNIAKVENGLLANAEVVFADSIVSTFNINDRMKFYKVPSVSIAVINNGKIEWAKTYGYADVSDNKMANVNTDYQAASISKSVNAFFIMKLVGRKKVIIKKRRSSIFKNMAVAGK